MKELEGISFMLRVRDEEDTLEKSIRSLFALKIPHEIVIILHLCTDKSNKIAEDLSKENSNIKIFTYDIEISRAGYETLATDDNSQHSLIRYYNWCLDKTKYPWIFKWDADHLASLRLIEFLNEKSWKQENIIYKIASKNEDGINIEPFLMGCLKSYKKYWFWEVPYFVGSNIKKIDLNHNICIEHNSSLSLLKSYWKKKSWFENDNSDEACLIKNRIHRLINDFCPEPIGMARAKNIECENILREMIRKKPDYINYDK